MYHDMKIIYQCSPLPEESRMPRRPQQHPHLFFYHCLDWCDSFAALYAKLGSFYTNIPRYAAEID